MDSGPGAVASLSAGPCFLKGIKVSWPGWSWASYLEQNRKGNMHHNNRIFAIVPMLHSVYSYCHYILFSRRIRNTAKRQNLLPTT